MTTCALAAAQGLLCEAAAVLREAVGSGAAGVAGADEVLLASLSVWAGIEREAQRGAVEVVAALTRRGVFAEHGQRPVTALCDLLGVEHGDARRMVTAAEQVCQRVDLHGQILQPLLPGMAAAFAAFAAFAVGTAGLRHVDVVARMSAGPAARRLSPEVWAEAEAQIAAQAGVFTPTELRNWGTALIEALDQDGAEPDDDREPDETNELLLTRNPNGRGGRMKGRFDDAAMFDVIAALIDAKAAPLTGDDSRPVGQRQAEAMAEIFGYVADHGDASILPTAGGERPHMNVLIRLEDLENRARAACMDFGGSMTAAAFRMLCCDAAVIPVVCRGDGQPLDVGRKTRVVPDGLRRAVAVRDRGCPHPGCDRTTSWSQVHHIVPWERGGATALANLVMLCSVHHREIHSSGWQVRIAPDGLPEFFPPPWIDPHQRVRRKPLGHVPGSGTRSGSPPTRPGSGPASRTGPVRVAPVQKRDIAPRSRAPSSE